MRKKDEKHGVYHERNHVFPLNEAARNQCCGIETKTGSFDAPRGYPWLGERERNSMIFMT
jgi:hypothetical protein